MEQKNKKERWLIFWILIAGFLFRVIGVSFGLPHLYHADEPILINHAMAYGAGDFNPHFFKIPPLVSYILFILYGIYFLLGAAIGLFSNPFNFAAHFITNPASFYLIARFFLGVLTGTATVYFLFCLTKKHFSYERALLTATFLATCFIHIQDSHYAYVDMPLLLILTIALSSILDLLDGGSKKAYVLVGFWVGLAVAVKYNGVFLVAPVFAAHYFRHRNFISAVTDVKIILSAFVSCLTFAALNSFSLIDFHFFYHQILEQGQAEHFLGWGHHFFYSLIGGIGLPAVIAGILGMIMCGVSLNTKKVVLSIFCICYYLILCVKSQQYARYVLPIVPFMLFFASDFLLNIKERWKLNRVSFGVLIICILTPSIAKACVTDWLFLKPDARTVALSWAKVNLDNHSKVALGPQFFTPRFSMDLTQITQKEREIGEKNNHLKTQQLRLKVLKEQALKKEDFQAELFFLSDEIKITNAFLFSTPRLPYNVNRLIDARIDYVVVSPFEKPRQIDFFDNLKQNAVFIHRVTPFRDGKQELDYDPYAVTAAPFIWHDLISRNSLGQVVDFYEFKRDG